MKTKFLLPVLAIVFAVGMSFTTAEIGEKQTMDYIRINNQWVAIPEVDCGAGTNVCMGRLPDGSVHQIFDLPSFSSLKDTDSKVPFNVNLQP